MYEELVYINDIDVLPDVNSITCDTRSFYILLSNKREDVDHIIGDIENLDEYLWSRSEILGLLKETERITGGKQVWRRYRYKDTGWAPKYIKFIKYNDGYIANATYNQPLKRADIDPDYIL